MATKFSTITNLEGKALTDYWWSNYLGAPRIKDMRHVSKLRAILSIRVTRRLLFQKCLLEGDKNIKGVTVLFVDNRATLINASLSKSIDFFDAL